MSHRHSLFALVAGAALVVPARADDKPREGDLNPRQVADAYLTAALSGKAIDAATHAVPGKQASTDKFIQELRKVVGSKTVPLTAAHASARSGRALVISEAVKMEKANPDGTDTAYLIVQVEKVGGKWLVKEVDTRPEANVKEQVKRFKERYDDTKDVPEK